MNRISLDQANRAIAAALAEGRALNLRPLGVAVVDPGGHLIAFQREDGAPSLRLQVAMAKAAGGLSLGLSSRRIGENLGALPGFVAALGALSPHGIMPAAGGLIAVDSAGEPLGAIGVTGDSADNDELCALAGLAAAGLAVQP